MKPTLALVLILLLALAGCAAPTPQPFPTTRALGTVAPSSTPMPTSMTTRKPTRTLQPSATITPKPTRTPRINNEATLTAGFPVNCGKIINEYDVLKSPGWNWLAVKCSAKQGDLVVTNRDGRQWTLPFGVDYQGGKALYADSPGGVYPLHWSPDETYLYFAPAAGFDAGGVCYYPASYQGLYRLNVNTGEVANLLPPNPDVFDAYEIAFSPQGEKLAYDAGTPIIYDLQSGRYIPMRGLKGETGSLLWSPDGTRLAFATCQTTADWKGVEESTVQVYSLDDGTSETILRAEGYRLIINGWTEDPRLLIEDCPTHGDCQTLYYEWETGQILIMTPTPTP